MSWLALLKALLTLANMAATRVRDDELREDGAARAALKQMEDLNARIEKAVAARADDGAGELRDDDGHRRD